MMPAQKWLIFIVLVLGLSLFLFCTLKISSKSAREEERRIKYKKSGEIIKIARNKLNLTLNKVLSINTYDAIIYDFDITKLNINFENIK